MSERTDYPAGVPCWVDTYQPDPEAARRFYGALFGWEFAGAEPASGSAAGGYLVARLRGRDVAGIGASARAAAGATAADWSQHVRVASADAAVERARSAGGAIVQEPFDALPAGRGAVLADPAGARFWVWEAGERRGAQVINEPSAWSMSQLLTADPHGAAAFYGAVFGWTTEAFDMGGSSFTLFRLPGYVGGEPQQPVSREVVATMSPARHTPARWTLNFWVRDVDEVARKAGALGGQVLTSPFPTPIGRSAVLADAQGASFTVSSVSGRA